MAGSVGAGLAAGLLTGGAEQFIDIGDKALQERAQMRRDQAKALADIKRDKIKADRDAKGKAVDDIIYKEESFIREDGSEGKRWIGINKKSGVKTDVIDSSDISQYG